MFKKIYNILITIIFFLSLIMSVNANLNTKLESYYSLDDFTDSTGNYPNLINSGTTSVGGGVIGNKLQFNSLNNNFIDTGFKLSGSQSISFWINVIDDNTYQDIGFGVWNDNNQLRLSWDNRGSSNIMYNYMYILGNVYAITSTSVTLGNWHHVVYNYDETLNKYEVFIDGVLIGSKTTSGLFTPDNNYRFGWSGFSGQDFQGFMDEIAIFNNALTLTEVTKLYNGGNGLSYNQISNPINMIINTPSDLTNYTFDVTLVPVDITTSVNTNCSYTNNYDNNTILFSTTGGKSHQTTLTLPPAINQSQTFNIDFTCNNVAYTQSNILTLFKQRVPLNLEIIVPKANQIFNIDTGQIEFFLETNYQTDCSYQRDTEFVRTPFFSTGGAIHKTNFTTDLNVSTYNMNFLCIGNIINENASKNITFFLDELNKFSLTKTTSQLPSVGKDIGDFMSNTTPGITEFIFNLAIISTIILLFGVILYKIRGRLV